MAAPWRQVIREQLEMLACEADQREYESNVPHVDITTELIAGWFDDSYHPQTPDFRSCFSIDELELLDSFNTLFGARVDRLPESNGTVESWLSSSVWREVMRAAAETLQRIAA